MHRSSKWTRLLALAVLIAVVGLVPPAGHVARALPLQQTTTKASQLVYLDGDGRLVAKAWQVQGGTRSLQQVWTSGNDVGWNYFTLGDFNDDNKKEVVATRGNHIKAFNPVPGSNPLTFDCTLNSGENFHLLAAGDFKGLGYDQLAVTYTYTDDNDNFHEVIRVYNPKSNTCDYTFVVRVDWDIQAIAAADVNRDSHSPHYADLSVLSATEKWFTILAGPNLTSQLWDENGYCCNWLDIAVGNVTKDADNPGNEFVTSRDVTEQTKSLKSLLLSWYNDNDEVQDLVRWDNYPSFYSLALADVNGDTDDEILALRDPRSTSSPYLVLFNPAGDSMRTFEPTGTCCDNAFNKVAAGDINGDGKAEVAVVRSNRLRIFYEPTNSNNYTDFGGTYWPDDPQVAIGDLGFGAGTLIVTPQALSFNFTKEQYLTVGSQTLTIDSGLSALNWTAQALNQPSWLSLSSNQGTTPASVRVLVSAQAAGLTPQTATIRISGSSGNVQVSPVDVPVSVSVADPDLVVSPSAVTFMREKNVGTSPSEATISIQRPSGNTSWTVTAMAISAPEFQDKLSEGAVRSLNGHLLIDSAPAAVPDWLQIAPTSGNTPDTTTLTVITSVADSLPVGTRKQALLVFVPGGTYDQTRIRSVAVNLYVAQQVTQMRLPLILQ